MVLPATGICGWGDGHDPEPGVGKAKISAAEDVRAGVQAYVNMGRLGRQEAELKRLQENRIWQQLNAAKKELSVGYFDRLRLGG